MAKDTAKKEKKNKLQAELRGYPVPAYDSYAERISIPFPIEDIAEMKIGQEVVVTIRGCVNRLEGDHHYSCVGLEIEEKSFRKTSNSQAEGIRKLSEDAEY